MKDIYSREQTLRNSIERIRNSDKIIDDNKLFILKFYQQCRAEGMSAARMVKYLYTLQQLSLMLNKSFEDASREDIVKLVEKIEGNGKWSDWTKQNYKVVLKRFFKWLRKLESKGVYPEEVSWIRTTMKNGNSRLPSEILTEEEIRRMAQVASSPRDRALVLVFYESGARVGELLPLKMKQVAFDDYGAVLLVRGKTRDRRIRLVLSSPALANWINIHPLREDPEANVWLSLSTNNDGHPLGYRGLYKLFQELAAKAQIRKKVNPHSFRHARATHLASKLTEQQLKMLFGWTQSSKMASVYVHLSGKDIDNALLELHGLTTQEKKESKLKVKVCPRCGEKNSPGGIYCRKCAFPIDAETMEWENKAMDELIRTPQVSRYLKRMLREILIKRRR